jgi:hypothetical protein
VGKGKQHLPERALAAFLRRAARLAWLEHRRAVRDMRDDDDEALSALALRLWENEVDGRNDDWVAAAGACVRQLQGRAARAVELAYRDGADGHLWNAAEIEERIARGRAVLVRAWMSGRGALARR